MKTHKRSYLLLTMSLVSLLIATIVIAGCIGNGPKTGLSKKVSDFWGIKHR